MQDSYLLGCLYLILNFKETARQVSKDNFAAYELRFNPSKRNE